MQIPSFPSFLGQLCFLNNKSVQIKTLNNETIVEDSGGFVTEKSEHNKLILDQSSLRA